MEVIRAKSFWEAVNIYLIKKGIRRTEFAEKISMDRSQLSGSLNSNGTPQKRTQVKIESALGVKVEQKGDGQWELLKLDEYLEELSPEERYDAETERLDKAVKELEQIIKAYKQTKRGLGKDKEFKLTLISGFKARLREIAEKYGK